MRALTIHSWHSLMARSRATFAALAIRNYRLFFIGQGISLSGTWMQTVAQGWLVLQLTGSGTQVGLVVATQFLPLLFVTPFGGMIADSFDKRRVFMYTQIGISALALALGLLVVFDFTQLWMVYLFALALGSINAISNPTRHAFVSEIVDAKHLKNAITLHAIVNNIARAVGPTIAGILIALFGIGFCFLANALTTVAIVYMTMLMRQKELYIHHSRRHMHPLRQLEEALVYAKNHVIIRDILLMIVVIGTLSYEFQTTLPIFAKSVFAADASSYARLWITFGIGSVIGGLFAAGRRSVSPAYIARAAILFGISTIAAASMPSLESAALLMFVVGFFSITFLSNANSLLQLECEPAMRGRVMSLWTMALLGSTPIGSAIVGFASEHIGARSGLLIGGAAAVITGLVAITTKLHSERLLAISAAIRSSIFETETEEEAKLR